MTRPLVSVGLPVYQGEAFVDDAIGSIRRQTLTDLELIISDNGSTDATEEICRHHAAEDARITYHRSPVNRGSSWNYCRLVGLASGSYFKWASHDDVLRPTFIERCAAVLDADPGVVLCHPGAASIDADGAERAQFPENWNASSGPPARRFADILFREGPCFPVFGLMRREVVERTGLLGAYVGHDRPFLAEMALHGRFAHVAEVLFLNREHPGRTSRAYIGPRDRIAWFDPAMAGKVVYYRPRLALEYHRAITRAGVPVDQAIRARLAIAGWAGKHAPGIARDILGGLRVHVRRALGRHRVDS
jgi:glycosyltransferase involved in cell wall biosynthesis